MTHTKLLVQDQIAMPPIEANRGCRCDLYVAANTVYGKHHTNKGYVPKLNPYDFFSIDFTGASKCSLVGTTSCIWCGRCPCNFVRYKYIFDAEEKERSPQWDSLQARFHVERAYRKATFPVSDPATNGMAIPFCIQGHMNMLWP